MRLALPSNAQKFFAEVYKKVNYKIVDPAVIMEFLFDYDKDSNP